MELHVFRKDFLETVKSLAAAEMDFEESSFVMVAAQKLAEAEELEDFEPCHFEGYGKRKKRLRVDGYCFDDDDESIKLLISYYDGNESPVTLSQSEVERVFDRLYAYVEDSISGKLHPLLEESTPGYALASDLYRMKEKFNRFKFYLITDGFLSSRVKDLQKTSLMGIPIEYNVWDITRFYRVFKSSTGREDLVIDFRDFSPEGIPCLEASKAEGEYKAYLCVIPGYVLADLYNSYGSRLLEGNVRSFLTTRGKVNKGIKTTILREPEMFFAFNNGIATTSTDAEIKCCDSGLRLVQATSLQIVNGGQTTASLALAKAKENKDLKNIYVPMKLSVVSPERAEVVIPQISICANSQNKVSEADFFSNHPFHIRLEDISRRLWFPAVGGSQHETHWFYERTRGQYLNEQIKMKPKEKKQFAYQNPRDQVITKTDVAKFFNSYRGCPQVVSLGAQKNFRNFATWVAEQWEKSDAIFNELFFRELIALGIIFKNTERLVSVQPWYQRGYRANIVTYTIAKLFFDIDKHFQEKVMDFRFVWSNKMVPGIVHKQLEATSREVFEVIVSPDIGHQNVTEWCKKDRCWERVKNLDVKLLKGINSCLMDKIDKVILSRESVKQQKIDNRIGAQIKVVALGEEYWKRLRTWAAQFHLLTMEEERLLRIASNINSGVLPTEKQCMKLLLIKVKKETEGFLG